MGRPRTAHSALILFGVRGYLGRWIWRCHTPDCWRRESWVYRSKLTGVLCRPCAMCSSYTLALHMVAAHGCTVCVGMCCTWFAHGCTWLECMYIHTVPRVTACLSHVTPHQTDHFHVKMSRAAHGALLSNTPADRAPYLNISQSSLLQSLMCVRWTAGRQGCNRPWGTAGYGPGFRRDRAY